MEVETLEVDYVDLSPEPYKVPRRPRGVALVGVCLSIVVGLQLIPSPDPPIVQEVVVPEPTDSTVQPAVINSKFQWIQVRGLDRFESITEPIPTSTGYISVANPWGASLAASVVVSKDGSQWNRWGTIHGIGGETQIDELREVDDEYMALGSYTESMPGHEFAVHLRLPAIWTSEDAINWEMFAVENEVEQILARLALQPTVGIGVSDAEPSVIVRTTVTPTVTLRERGMRGDPFAVRADSVTQSLLITQDQNVWFSEVVPFDRIDFLGDVAGTFLIRAWSDAEPIESSFWLVTP
jgi:hypothetical protein